MSQLPNYLLSNRKRLSLSQEEVAFLLGNQKGGQVCRYERFAREPSLETVLAFEVIFQRPVSELFGGLYLKVEEEIMTRARTLASSKDQPKRQVLTNIANNTLN